MTAHPPQPPIAAHGCRWPSRRGPEGGLFPRGGEGRTAAPSGIMGFLLRAGRSPPMPHTLVRTGTSSRTQLRRTQAHAAERGSPSVPRAEYPLRARPGHRPTYPAPPLPPRPAEPNRIRACADRLMPGARRPPPHVPSGQAQGGNRDANGAEPLARLLLSSQIS